MLVVIAQKEGLSTERMGGGCAGQILHQGTWAGLAPWRAISQKGMESDTLVAEYLFPINHCQAISGSYI